MSFDRIVGSARRSAARAALVAVALSLAGCVTPPAANLRPGQTEADMLAVMGQPTGRYALASSQQRVEYAKGPNGKFTWMVDLDATGRVKAVVQVLTPQYFNQVRRGMTSQELLVLLGRPSEKSRQYLNREAWSWRFENNDCQWASVTVANGWVLGDASYLPDPQCERSY